MWDEYFGRLSINTRALADAPYRRDVRIKRTLWFFFSKKMITNGMLPVPYQGLLSWEDVLWACEKVPDLYQALPLAYARFPRHLPGRVPDDLSALVRHLKTGAMEGPDYKGHPYHMLWRFFRLPIRDRRLSATPTERAHFTIDSAVVALLRAHAKKTGQTQSEVVTTALRSFLLPNEPPPKRLG